MLNNLAALTQSHKAIAAKKNARRGQVKEVLFDDDARRCVHNHAPAPLLTSGAGSSLPVFINAKRQRQMRLGKRPRSGRSRSISKSAEKSVFRVCISPAPSLIPVTTGSAGAAGAGNRECSSG